MVSPAMWAFFYVGPAENTFAKGFGWAFYHQFFVFVVVKIWLSVRTPVTFVTTYKKKEHLD